MKLWHRIELVKGIVAFAVIACILTVGFLGC